MKTTLVSKNRPEHQWSEIPSAFNSEASEVERFEKAFASYVGGKYAIAFPYSRVALHAALSSLAPAGDRVALTGYTCVVIPHAVVLAGKTPHFVDIDPSTYNAEGEALAAVCDKSTSAVVTTSMYGNPLDPSAIERLTDRPRILVEDHALSLHTPFRSNNPLLTSVAIYSFGFNKILSTLSGGMLVTFDERAARLLRQHRDEKLKRSPKKTRAAFALRLIACKSLFAPVLYSGFDRLRHLPWIEKEIDNRSFEVPSFPPDAAFQMHADQASLGQVQLKRADLFLEKRRRWAERYAKALDGLDGVIAMPLQQGAHYSHYTVRIGDRDQRNFRQKMRRHGVEVGRTLDYSMPSLEYYRSFSGACPEAERAANEIVNLPNYPGLTDESFERILEAVRRSL